MTTESDKTQLERLTYFIDLDCFKKSDRSFATVVEHCLCSACRERLATSISTTEPALLVQNIKDCCSKRSDFIYSKLPLLERVFRIFLAGGNQPLTLDELAAQLGTYSDGSFSPSLQMLRRLLDSDRYYGFRPKPRGTRAR